MNGYCEKHHEAYEFKCLNGQWVYECSKCRKEGAYDTYASTSTTMLPTEMWTVSNSVNYKVLEDNNAEA